MLYYCGVLCAYSTGRQCFTTLSQYNNLTSFPRPFRWLTSAPTHLYILVVKRKSKNSQDGKLSSHFINMKYGRKLFDEDVDAVYPSYHLIKPCIIDLFCNDTKTKPVIILETDLHSIIWNYFKFYL